MTKKGKMAKLKAGHKVTGKKGYPVYVTINASHNKQLVLDAIEKAYEEAYEYQSVLYITINSGNPPPPPCLPGQNCG